MTSKGKPTRMGNGEKIHGNNPVKRYQKEHLRNMPDENENEFLSKALQGDRNNTRRFMLWGLDILSNLLPIKVLAKMHQRLSDYEDHKNLTKLSEKYIVALPSVSQDPPPPLNFIVYLILCSQT
ncbi:hypothetical protein RHGRI_020194 [Rhododendron griersonianum]|uniref:Uncharacterized protein n=1 Tax=Rhododendron griersonianum TaxID=479676 RepID=A0AAV6JJP4_9ERIC|nr:hypothetical protein RHGRI_020194 [Rhododendron griersonianum]